MILKISFYFSIDKKFKKFKKYIFPKVPFTEIMANIFHYTLSIEKMPTKFFFLLFFAHNFGQLSTSFSQFSKSSLCAPFPPIKSERRGKILCIFMTKSWHWLCRSLPSQTMENVFNLCARNEKDKNAVPFPRFCPNIFKFHPLIH